MGSILEKESQMSPYWSDEEFVIVVKKSKSIGEVVRHFGCPTNQGHYNRQFHKTVQKLNLDISHLREGVKQINFNKKIPIEELLVVGPYRSTQSFKERLLKEKILQNKCSECSLTDSWNNKKLSLQLDHINGNNCDNRLENLRIVCPNCHSQTETFCGSKAKKEKHAYKYVCKSCKGPKKYDKSEFCQDCSAKERIGKTIIDWPSPEEVWKLVQEHGFSKAGRLLGVTDNGIRNFLTRNEIDIK